MMMQWKKVRNRCKREEKKEARRREKIFISELILVEMNEMTITKKREWAEGCVQLNEREWNLHEDHIGNKVVC
jgi:hypothetical protein